jgi:dephospho-CoA kinase
MLRRFALTEVAEAPFVRLRVPIVGVVGGIGSGKSQVAQLLAESGGTVAVDSDQIGHRALRQPEIRAEVIGRLGDGTPGGGILGPDGAVDRKKLGAIVFGEAAKLRELEKITHPWIRQQTIMALEVEAKKPGAKWVVLDASVLLESGWKPTLSRVVYVHAPDAVRLARVLSRPGWTEEIWKSREKSQLPLTNKRRMSDDVVINSSDLDALGKQLSYIIKELESLSSNPA